MHVLTVLDHPDAGSFSHAVAQRFTQGIKDAGHTGELADLHSEGFDPRWSLADLAQNTGEPMPADVLAEQKRIDRCDAICLIFPLFWYGMPAMMKGWLDRVWSWGWAYDQLEDYNQSLQRPRTGLMLVPAGASPAEWEEYGFDKAMNLIWKTGTMGFFGLSDTNIHYLNGANGTRKRRLELLERSYQAGLSISAPLDIN